MSKPGIIYRLKWDTVPVKKVALDIASQVITVSIYDTENLIADEADEVIYDLIPAMSPLVIQSIDNNEDKFTPVRAKQARIKFISNSSLGQDASLFFDSSDTRWKVVISCPIATIFTGFLVIPDIQQDFLPDPNEVELTATDMLGSLSNQDLTYFDGSNPIGKYTIGQFVAMALAPTGLNLPINVINNVRYYSGATDGHLYEKIFLDAKTFEASIGQSEKCRTVLEKILGEDCVLFQWKGEWWILRIDEIDDNLIYVAAFDTDGTLTSYLTPINPTKSVGANSAVAHSDAATVLRSDRRHKLAKLTYKFITPAEIVCNMDFSRGDETTAPDLGAPTSTGTYDLDCWTMRRTAGAITSTAHIKRDFVFGTETLRYVTITPATGTATPFDFIQSQAVEMRQNDRGSISVEYRWPTNMSGGGSTYFLMKVFLHGDDGNWYYWWNGSTPLDTSTFYWTSSPTETDRSIPSQFDVGAIDETQWRTLSVDFGAIPVDGKLYIGLYQGHQGESGGDNQDIHYQGLRLTYNAFINGSYQLFTGQYNQVTALNPAGLIQTREKEVFISDSPRKEFKGAPLYYDGTKYILANQFYTSNTFALGAPPSADYVHPFGHIQAYAVWNQYRNACRIFPSALYGLFLTTFPNEWPDLVHKYQLSDVNANTNNRYFLLISMEQDWKTCKWRGTFIESYNRITGHNYDDTKEFKYITS
jgi:hypothetical protein